MILLIVLCCVLMYLIFGRGQAGVGISGDEFDLYKHKDGGNESLLKELDEHYSHGLANAIPFKSKRKHHESRSTPYDPSLLGGVAFSPFAKIYETTYTDSDTDHLDAESTVYTHPLYNHERKYGTLFNDGDTHYPRLSEGKPVFNSRILPKRSTAVPNTVSVTNHGSANQFTGFI